jgi:hypothetical protein
MNRLLLVIALALPFFSACAPIKQIEWRTSTDRITIAPQPDLLHVSVLTNSAATRNKVQLNRLTSYAESSSGRFGLRTEVNEYAAQFGGPWTQWRMYLVDPTAKSGDETTTFWRNGEWQLHLEFTGGAPLAPIDAKFKLWTFYYSPLVDGYPN